MGWVGVISGLLHEFCLQTKFTFFPVANGALVGKGSCGMKVGTARVLRLGRSLLLVLVALAISGSVGLAQTPDAACAADSLYLISPAPENLFLALQASSADEEDEARQGLLLSWPNLDVTQATCFSISEITEVDFEMEVAGGFRDAIDRVFLFTAPNVGTVGSITDDQVYLSWGTTAETVIGTIRGEINLANNGGVLRYDLSADEWIQVNIGLPRTMRKTNVLALAEGKDGFLVGAFSGGISVTSTPEGVFTNAGTGWSRLRSDLFDGSTQVTNVAVSASNSQHFAVGTNAKGVFVTRDGGVNFTQWRSELADPAPEILPTDYRVKAMDWSSDRFFVVVANFGIFVSEDEGQTFSHSEFLLPRDLADPESELIIPSVNSLTVDKNNNDRVFLCLQNYGVYESLDGGDNWHDLGGDLVVPDPDQPFAYEHSALSVAVDAVDDQLLVAGFLAEGLYRSPDGGNTWTYLDGAPQPANLGDLETIQIISTPTAGEFFALEDLWSVLHSTDGGQTWDHFATQPVLDKGRDLLMCADDSGDFYLASYGGGIYESRSWIPLHETMIVGTDDDLLGFDLGLDIRFTEGAVAESDSLKLTCQTYQGWAVWRSPSHDPDNMEMLGMFDLVNPEDCIIGFCGDINYDPIPRCFASKRAACFNFDTPDTVRFFDEEVYNGFAYYYAVTSIDYGNTAEISAESSTNLRQFSPRFDGDPESAFNGPGSRKFILVNTKTEPAEKGEEIYVFPNPLRPGEGFADAPGSRVRFTNLPAESRVRVFTLAGDDVIDLGPELQVGDNIDWVTVNREGVEVGPGAYIYKVVMPQREPYWGRLIVIR